MNSQIPAQSPTPARTQPLKIGVLTFHRCINYGSFWQARGLVEGLQKRGHDTVLLDHHSRRVNFREWRCALRPTWPTPIPTRDYPRYREKTEKFFQAFESLPMSARFDLENPEAMDELDIVVVGSDEVWNLRHPWYAGSTLFYGVGLRAPRLVSYAASFGNYDASEGLSEAWTERLRHFHAISVRDNNSRAIIENALGFSPASALDPCLQFPIELEGEAELEDEALRIEEPCVAVYGHNFSPQFSRNVKQWARERNFRLVSIGYRNDWADEQRIEAGPHQFAHLMKNAQAVATNFFHGCVFALHFHKPFVCETTSYRFHKVRDLMTTVGGQAHLMSEDAPFSDYAARLDEPSSTRIEQNIVDLRRTSDAFLDAALSS